MPPNPAPHSRPDLETPLTDESAWRYARKYYLHNACLIRYVFSIIASVCFAVLILDLAIRLREFTVSGTHSEAAACVVTALVYVAFFWFTLSYMRTLDRRARYFASEAIDDGNYTPADIAKFYSSYVLPDDI